MFPVAPAYTVAGAVIVQFGRALTTTVVVAGALLVQPLELVTVSE
jgi:hypothetical protein